MDRIFNWLNMYKYWFICAASIMIGLTVLLQLGSNKVLWDCFVFPDREDLFRYHSIGEYSNLALCKKAGEEELSRLHAMDKGYFQCGQNCFSKSGIKTISACKKIKH